MATISQLLQEAFLPQVQGKLLTAEERARFAALGYHLVRQAIPREAAAKSVDRVWDEISRGKSYEGEQHLSARISVCGAFQICESRVQAGRPFGVAESFTDWCSDYEASYWPGRESTSVFVDDVYSL